MAILRGYAAVWGAPSAGLPFQERIQQGAFARSLRTGAEIAALAGHDSYRVLGRTSNGSLRLQEDDVGLTFECEIPNTPTGGDMAHAVASGLVTGVSTTFEAKGETWRHGERDITDADLLEISFTDRPYYPATSIRLEDQPC